KRPFARRVVASAARRLAAVELSQIVDPRELRLMAAFAAGALAALVLAAVLAAPTAEKAMQIAYLKLFPSSVSIAVRSGDMRIPAGKPVRIEAQVNGPRGALTRIAPQVTIEAAQGQPVVFPMTRSADRYELRINALERSFKYRVTAGPAASRIYGVTALFPPRVQRIELHYDYPSFTGLKPRDERDGGDVYAPA